MVYKRPARSDELMHFGVKGMKWGVRRYQNEDGSLTPAGRKRYGSKENFEYHQKLKRAKRKGWLIGAGAAAGAGVAMTKAAKSVSNGNPGNIGDILDQNIKSGKDKAPQSPAEVITKQTEKGIRGGSSALRKISSMQRKNAESIRDPQVEREIKRMSNKELQDYISRQNLERQYRSLRRQDIEYGSEKAADVLDIVGDVASIAASAALIAGTIYKIKH